MEKATEVAKKKRQVVLLFFDKLLGFCIIVVPSVCE